MASLFFCAAVLIALALLVRKVVRSWLHPSALLLLMWSAIFISTGVFAPEYSFSIEGGWAMILLLASFSFGGSLGSSLCQTRISAFRTVTCIPIVRVKALSLLLTGGAIFGFVAVLVVLASRGFSVEALSDVDALMEASHDFSVARYEDNYQMPGVARLFLTFNYVSVAISGVCVGFGSVLVWNKKGWIRTALFTVPLTPQIALAIVMTTRAQVLYELIVWFSFYMAGAVFAKRKDVHMVFTSARAIQFFGFVAFLVALFVSLQFLRAGITDFDRVWDVLDHLKKWPFGSIGGFTIWWSSGVEPEFSFGYYSFTGLFEWLGIRGRENGLYVDYVKGGGRLEIFILLFEGSSMTLAGSGL